MPSSYSPRLRFELVADGEQLGVWGQTTNRNLGQLIEDALAGYTSIAMSNSNLTLSAANGLPDQSRFLMIEFTGTLTATRTITVPAVSKTYIIRNSTTHPLVITPSGGTGTTVPVGKTRSLMTQGTSMVDALNMLDSLDLNSGVAQALTVVTATIQGGTATFATATINGGTITGTAVRNLPVPTLAGDAARKDYVDAIVALVQADADAAAASAASAALSAANALNSANQAALSSTIAQGAANYQGDYNPATPYTIGQSVSFMGEFYYSKVNDNLGNTPMEGMFWALADFTADNIQVNPVSANATYYLAFVPNQVAGVQPINIDSSGGGYNPATNTAGINISGNAATATSATTAISADSAISATNSTNVNVTATAANASYPLVLAPSQTTGQKALLMDSSGGTYNPATNTADFNISGNAASATLLTSNQSNWASTGVIANVVGQLAWKNFGNGHTVFDASNGTSPSGSTVSNVNAQIAWTNTYPTLMGWNGSNTYGVRVDSARRADSAATVDNGVFNNGGTYNINITGNSASAYGLGVQGNTTPPAGRQVLASGTDGYAWLGYINSNTPNSENPTISQVVVTNGDNFMRKASLEHLANTIRPRNATYAGEFIGSAFFAGQYDGQEIKVPLSIIRGDGDSSTGTMFFNISFDNYLLFGGGPYMFRHQRANPTLMETNLSTNQTFFVLQYSFGGSNNIRWNNVTARVFRLKAADQGV